MGRPVWHFQHVSKWSGTSSPHFAHVHIGQQISVRVGILISSVNPAPVLRAFDSFPCPTHNEFMTIALARDVEEFLQEQVQAGICSDPSELVNDLIRSLRDQKQRPFQVTPELEAWLLEAADEPSSPLAKEDFDAIRNRVQTRLKSVPS
jgi:Arc/MetJ-type ribon-helix-helix transcriptional regulator